MKSKAIGNYYISGPSGCGKTQRLRKLKENWDLEIGGAFYIEEIELFNELKQPFGEVAHWLTMVSTRSLILLDEMFCPENWKWVKPEQEANLYKLFDMIQQRILNGKPTFLVIATNTPASELSILPDKVNRRLFEMLTEIQMRFES